MATWKAMSDSTRSAYARKYILDVLGMTGWGDNEATAVAYMIVAAYNTSLTAEEQDAGFTVALEAYPNSAMAVNFGLIVDAATENKELTNDYLALMWSSLVHWTAEDKMDYVPGPNPGRLGPTSRIGRPPAGMVLVGDGTPFQVRLDANGGPAFALDTSSYKGERTASGLGVRNSRQYWREWRDRYGDGILSESNRAMIARGRAPVVDDAWIAAFPKQAPFKGVLLEHHHVGGGALAIPLPATVHKGTGNKLQWHDR